MLYNIDYNGVAERKNRSIMGVDLAMLHDRKLSKFLWGENKNTMVYIQNKVPHQALGIKIFEEVFTGVKPDFGHIRIYGFLVYFHVSKDKRNKLESTGKKGTFFGYRDNSKVFRICMVKGKLSLVRM